MAGLRSIHCPPSLLLCVIRQNVASRLNEHGLAGIFYTLKAFYSTAQGSPTSLRRATLGYNRIKFTTLKGLHICTLRLPMPHNAEYHERYVWYQSTGGTHTGYGMRRRRNPGYPGEPEYPGLWSSTPSGYPSPRSPTLDSQQAFDQWVQLQLRHQGWQHTLGLTSPAHLVTSHLQAIQQSADCETTDRSSGRGLAG